MGTLRDPEHSSFHPIAPLSTPYGSYLDRVGHSLARATGLRMLEDSMFRFNQLQNTGASLDDRPHLTFLGETNRPFPPPPDPDAANFPQRRVKLPYLDHWAYSNFWWEKGKVPHMPISVPKYPLLGGCFLQADFLQNRVRPRGEGFFLSPWREFRPFMGNIPAFYARLLSPATETLTEVSERERRTHLLKLRLRRKQLPTAADAYFTRWVEGYGHFARRPVHDIYLSHGRFDLLDRLRFSVLWDESFLYGAFGGHFFLTARLLLENLTTIIWLLQHGSFSGKLINFFTLFTSAVDFELFAALCSAL